MAAEVSAVLLTDVMVVGDWTWTTRLVLVFLKLTSNINLLNAIYAATIRLVASSYYLVPANQGTTGYPGPPKKVSGVLPEVDEPDAQEAAP